jgi:hypothetical protein
MEAMARVLEISPYEFLIPSKATQRLLEAPEMELEELSDAQVERVLCGLSINITVAT